MKLALTLSITAMAALLSACAGMSLSTDGGKRAEPGQFTQGFRS